MKTLSIEQIAEKAYGFQENILNCNLNIISFTFSCFGNPVVHLTEESFRNNFKHFHVTSRDSEEFNYELNSMVGLVKFFTLSSKGE